MENFTSIDIFIVVVLLVSAFLSTCRGFVSEMLGLGSWILAAIIGFYTMPYLEPFVTQYVPKPLFANILSWVCVSFVSLIVLTVAFSKVTKLVQKSILNRADHFLGLFFGIFRGVLILELLYFMTMTLAPKYLEKIEKKSQMFPYFEVITENIQKTLPESLFDNPIEKSKKEKDDIENLINRLNSKKEDVKDEIKDKAKDSKKKIEKKAEDTQETLFDALNTLKVEAKDKIEEKGYDKKEREQLDKLFLEIEN